MWLSAFIFVAFVGGIILCMFSCMLFLLNKQRKSAKLTALLAAVGTATYTAMLVVSGVTSHATELARGSEKHICELDCHLAYAVTATQQKGGDYAISLRVRFDEKTIGAERGNGELFPGGRRIELIDENGAKYKPVAVSGLNTALRPGESTTATLRFALPANAKPARLRFEDSDPSKRLLLGSETAPLHKRTTFLLT